MQEREANPKDSIENIVESLLEITSQYSRANDTSLARERMEIYASAEEEAAVPRGPHRKAYQSDAKKLARVTT
jgi:hypothetical protein